MKTVESSKMMNVSAYIPSYMVPKSRTPKPKESNTSTSKFVMLWLSILREKPEEQIIY